MIPERPEPGVILSIWHPSKRQWLPYSDYLRDWIVTVYGETHVRVEPDPEGDL